MWVWGMANSSSKKTCPNCGHDPFNPKDYCEKCGYKEPNRSKLPDAYFIFCNECDCHYTSENGACPLHGFGPVIKPKLSK